MIKQYEKYKKSGVEWLGEIPEKWSVIKLKFIGDAFIGLTYTPDDVVDEGQGILVLRSSNIQEGRLSLTDNVFVGSKVPEKLFVKSGDVLICSRNGSRELIGKNLLIGDECKGMTFGAFMTIFRTEHSKFVYYFFNSQIFKALSSLFLSSTINQLTLGVLNDMIIALPPQAEQTQIARFLDYQTALTDTIIAKKQKLVELLEEKRQSVINEAVTRGLNQHAPIKDSGVEWLGAMPEHWILQPLKYIVSLKGRLGWKGLKAEEYVPEGYGFLSTPDIKNEYIDFGSINYITEQRYLESPEIMLEPDDVLLVKDGSTLGIVNIVRELPIPSTVNSSIGVLRVLDKNILLPEYLHAQLSSDYIQAIVQQLKAGQGVPHLFQKDINNFLLILPPIEEQRQIVQHLVAAKAQINLLISKIEAQIEKIKEYRQSLISEAVTGKIDVRDWEPSAT